MDNIFETIYRNYLIWYESKHPIPYKKIIECYEYESDNSNRNYMVRRPVLNQNKLKSLGYNPLTIFQFYLIFLTLFVITGGIIMTIIMMIQS